MVQLWSVPPWAERPTKLATLSRQLAAGRKEQVVQVHVSLPLAEDTKDLEVPEFAVPVRVEEERKG